MNKEYIYLSDKEIVVTDENGHNKKRSIDSYDMHNLLLLENDLEKINNKIHAYESWINSYSTKAGKFYFFMTRHAKKFVLLPGIMVGAFTIQDILDPTIQGSHMALALYAFMAVPAFPMIKDMNEDLDAMKGAQKALEKAYEMKKEIEKRIENIKTKDKDIDKIVDCENSMNYKQDVVVLEDNTPFYEEALEQIHMAYNEGCNQKHKKRVLTKSDKQ